MRHKGIVRHLCHYLNRGLGINEACAELGLTTTYIAKRCKRTDRVRLHQAHMLYVEGLQRELVQRARLGRPCGRLKQVIDDLPPLNLPGDDKDEEREYRKWRHRNFDNAPVNQSLAEVRRLLQNSGDVEDDATETVSSIGIDSVEEAPQDAADACRSARRP